MTKTKIYDIVGEIRKMLYPHHYRETLKVLNLSQNEYYQLCSIFDTVEDTAEAINVPRYLLDKSTDVGIKYNIIYGILQAMFIQQDACNILYNIFKIKFDFFNELDNVRNLRNIIVGHPVSNTRSIKGEEWYTAISRATISSDGFQTIAYGKNTKKECILPTKFETIHFETIIIQQNKVTYELLNRIYEFLKEKKLTTKES